MERPFPVNEALTAISVGYSNPSQALIADQVLPRVPVMSERFSWIEHPLAEGFTYPETRVGRRGRPNQMEFTGIERQGRTNDYALDDPIPMGDINEAARQRQLNRSAYDPRAHSAKMLTSLILLDREVRVANKVFSPDNYSSGRKLALLGGAKFSDYTDSDPIGVITGALAGTLVFRPNLVVMGQSVWDVIRSHPHIVNAVRGQTTTRGIITREEFGRLFEIPKVLVGEGFVNTARKGQAPVIQRVWGKNMAFLHIDPEARPDRGGITFGFTAEVNSRVAGTILDPNIGMEGGEVVRVGEKVEEIICAPDVGYLVTGAVA